MSQQDTQGKTGWLQRLTGGTTPGIDAPLPPEYRGTPHPQSKADPDGFAQVRAPRVTAADVVASNAGLRQSIEANTRQMQALTEAMNGVRQVLLDDQALDAQHATAADAHEAADAGHDAGSDGPQYL